MLFTTDIDESRQSCTCGGQQTHKFSLHESWRTAEGQANAESITRAYVHVCLYPTVPATQSRSRSVAKAKLTLATSRGTRPEYSVQTNLTTNAKCRHRGYKKKCARSNFKFSYQCVWRRFDFTDVVVDAVRSMQPKITVFTELKMFNCKAERHNSLNECFSFQGNNPDQEFNPPLLEVRYRPWFKVEAKESSNSADIKNPKYWKIRSTNNCSLQTTSHKLVNTYLTVQNESFSFEENKHSPKGVFSYSYCSGHCHARNQSNLMPSVAEVLNTHPVEQTCRAEYADELKYLVAYNANDNGIIRRVTLWQKTAVACKCNFNNCGGAEATPPPAPGSTNAKE